MSIVHDSYTHTVGRDTNPAFMKLIVEHDDLPIPKGQHARLLRMFDDDNLSRQELVKTIQSDPVLTSRIIGAANSVTYRACGKTGTLPEAITRVGLLRIRQIVLGISVIEANRRGRHDGVPLDYTAYWRFSLAVAVVAESLGRASKARHQPGDMFTAGLLSQIVWPALAATFPDRLAGVHDSIRAGEPRGDAVARFMPAPPAHVSAAIADRIGLPPWMSNAIGLHEGDGADTASDIVRSAAALLDNASRIAQFMQPFVFASSCGKSALPDEEMLDEWKGWRAIVNL